MSITNGSVRYLKRIRTADYEHEEAAADISFTVPEGGDYAAVLSEAQGTALDTVYRMLGLRSDTMAPVTPAPVAEVPNATTQAAMDEGRTKRASKAKAADPLAPGSADAEAAPPASASTSEELPPVSDSDLTSFVAKRNDELIAAHAAANGGDGRAGTAKLRECVAEYSGVTPPTVRGIPAEKRHAFMVAAKALS